MCLAIVKDSVTKEEGGDKYWETGSSLCHLPIPEPSCLSLPWNGRPWSVLVLISTKLQALGILALEIQHCMSDPIFFLVGALWTRYGGKESLTA